MVPCERKAVLDEFVPGLEFVRSRVNGVSERNYITNQKKVSVVHERIRSMSLTHGVSKQHAYLISYLTNKVDCLYLMSTVAIYIYIYLYILYYIITTFYLHIRQK